jgi:hypothetical protein
LQTIATPAESAILGIFPSFCAASGGRSADSGVLEGCIVFAQDGVFELVGHVDPREMFSDMVTKVIIAVKSIFVFQKFVERVWKQKKPSLWERRADWMCWDCTRRLRRKRKKLFCFVDFFYIFVLVIKMPTMVGLWSCFFLQK